MLKKTKMFTKPLTRALRYILIIITSFFLAISWSYLWDLSILGDPGADSRDDTMFVVKVYCKIETSPWALTLTENRKFIGECLFLVAVVKLVIFPGC